MRRVIVTAVLVAVSSFCSNVNAGIFNRGDCCAPAVPSCGCEVAAPSCGCEVSCAPSCGPRFGGLRSLFGRLQSMGSCCTPAPSCGCAAPAPSCGCAAPAPSCGCEVAAPSCGCESACAPVCAPSCGGKLKDLLGRLKARRACAPSCCEVAPSCGCEVAAPSCGCGN